MSVCMREGLFEMGRQDFICQASDFGRLLVSKSYISHSQICYKICYNI